MRDTQWLVLVGNVIVVAFQSYLFRWQRSALMFARRIQAEQGTQFQTHMALVPFWQAALSWPTFVVKWGAWVSLWFFFPWYVPVLFVVAGFLLTAFHSATTSGREHQSYFENKMKEGI